MKATLEAHPCAASAAGGEEGLREEAGAASACRTGPGKGEGKPVAVLAGGRAGQSTEEELASSVHASLFHMCAAAERGGSCPQTPQPPPAAGIAVDTALCGAGMGLLPSG